MGYFDGYYAKYFLNDFADVFREYWLINDEKGREVFFRNFFAGEFGSELRIRNWNSFKRTCKELIRLGYYSPIVKFMYGIFKHSNKYDLAMITCKLQGIALPNGSNLAELCKDFYTSMQKRLEERKATSEKDITIFLPEYLATNIYGLDIDMNQIKSKDIDLLVKKAIEMKKEEYEKENERIEVENIKIEESEKIARGHMRLPRVVRRKPTEFDIRIMIPAALLDLFRAAELTGHQIDICYYIFAKYVWPTFSLVPWKQKNKLEVRYMGILAAKYTDAIFNLEVGNNPNLRLYATNPLYSDSDFYKELIGNTNGALLKPGIELYAKYPELGLAMAKTVSMAKEIIKQEMPDYLYSFLMAFIPYILYCCGKKDESAEFLIRYFEEINHDEKRKLYIQLILVRSILSSSKLEKASTLYGYYSYEMDRQAREKAPIIDFIDEMIQYLLDVKEYLELSNESTYRMNRLFADIVFGDGRIISDVEAAKSEIAKNHVPTESLFKKLINYVEALSNPNGIRLGALGLPNEDGCSYLENALSEDLEKQGRGFVVKLDEYLAYYQSLEHLKLRKNVNVFLQQHVSNLMDATINESIQAIKELRLQFLSDGIESDRQEFVTEQILSKISEVISRLSSRLQSQYIGRTEIEMHIANLQKEFIKRFRLKVPDRNLLALLPAEIQGDCINFIITSDIVFRMLSARSDREQLDFSPALIPLTKVLEMLLNHVFQRMNVTEYPEMDTNTRNSFFDRNGRKDAIEFGPCIHLLCDARIGTDKENGRIKLYWRRKYIANASRFEYWGGNHVLDMDKLKQFAGLNVLFERTIENPDGSYTTEVETAAFHYNREFNRMLLAKGLEYVKNNYRNIVAHKDGVSRQTVEECRDILLQSENLLWILIYILK